MNNTATEWTLDGFVEHFGFVHDKMLDHKFAWVLGAGASYASGIPLGSKLVDDWLLEMYRKEDGGKVPLETWATAEGLGIVGFRYDQRASFYPKIYQRRFREYPEEGYAYLESVMSGKDPSPGYSILASALAADPPRHNVVVTTNFDNLVADALSIYTDTFPFVCGHESLTSFVRVAMRRPLICKIHRDLLLGPQNDPRSLRRLHDAWGAALRALFQHYTPLFIGYGGNDDTLMDLLESLQPGDIKGQMVWCYHEEGKPNERIINAVTDLKGVLVPVPDFDLLMVLLGEKMGIGLHDEDIDRRASERTRRYRERIQHLDTVRHPSVTKALAATLERSGGWWAWVQKAKLERDPERRETVYRQAMQQYPKSAPLCCSFAHFLSGVCQKHDEAEGFYRRAVAFEPKDVIVLAAYASFLSLVRGKHEEADKLYRKAHQIDPREAVLLTNRAIFLWKVRGKPQEAEKLWRKAIRIEPNDPYSLGGLAAFVWQIHGNYDEAERLFRRSLELDPTNANDMGNYAGLLLARGRLDDASEKLDRVKSLILDQKSQLNAELAFYGAVIARAKQQDDAPFIGALKSLFSSGFQRSYWSFDEVLGFVEKNLPAEDHALYSALAAGILDPKRVPDVDTLLRRRLNARSQDDRSGAKGGVRKPTKAGADRKRKRKRVYPLR